MSNYRRLPLSGLKNARELGGFPTRSGATKFGVFIRSELPQGLTEEDKLFLKEYGVKEDLDFRGSFEIEHTRDQLEGEDWIRYIHMPMFDITVAGGNSGVRRLIDDKDFTWGDHYIEMAETHKDWVKKVLERLSEAEGTVLFHCTTGKDRTGIITALLLGLCGVCREDIVADYCVSQVYLLPMFLRMQKFLDGGGKSLEDPFFSTAPEHMVKLLDHIDKKYGGIEWYLSGCDTSAETITKLREKLT